ncbi:SoxR reducing system RseC family protein [Halosquirtibacter laminarini]|uniref:SoxR reducing system RseC family protein n=1 Tax=Halosquirtibacter laminarini TaxID=3374600 RepID=A0AC61NPU0_9BACT|nr:SoxR reducing system RseC family protein [Prolixibacteraceae bacterium]
MDKNRELTHDGVVYKTEGKEAWVKIISKSACAGCHAKGACSVADVEEKMVHIKRVNQSIKNGEKVLLVANKRQEKLAVILGYILPLCILIIALIVSKNIGFSDTISAVIAIAILVPYYLGLYLFRNRISGKLEFTIRKI